MKRSVAILCLATGLVASAYAEDIDAREYYRRGAEAFDEGEYFDAVEQFKLSLGENPYYVDPLQGLAESFLFLGEYEEALSYVRQARPLDRENLDLAVLEGRVLLGMGAFEEAREIFERTLEREPNNTDAWFGLAELDLAFGKVSQAGERYRQALRVSPANRRALLSLVLVLDELGREDEAASLVEEALAYYPRNAQVRYIAAKHYAEHDDLDDAEYHAARAVELEPGYRDAALLLAEIYLRTEQNPRAVTMLEDLIATDREQPLVWYGLGTAYRRLTRYEEAMNAFAFAIRYRPDDEISRISLERLIIDHLKLGDARRSRFAEHHIELGQAYQDRNYLDRALRAYRRALLIDPHSRQARKLYAEVFRIQGFPAKYLNELRVLLDLGYDDPAIRDSIEIQESLVADTVAESWGIDQYAVSRGYYTMDVHVGTTRLLHLDAQADLGKYLKSVLLHRERIRIPEEVSVNVTYGTAFSRSRRAGSDFFLLVDFEESDRHFATSAALYNAGTGAQLETFQVIRTGNNRVADAINLLTREIYESLPVSGTIIRREFDTALIDLGKLEEVEIDDELLILKAGSLRFTHNDTSLTHDPEDVLGTLTVSRVDELISEGTIEQSRFFDLVNIGDRVVPTEEPAEETGDEERPISEGLYREILDIR